MPEPSTAAILALALAALARRRRRNPAEWQHRAAEGTQGA
ncbi:MAG: PEP-CTERM sorting domain-containing protein [Planctomycetes bacterium]|nr:PEP-CTERM sorting domain-containing protein [Planctomycetota bacterium]